MNNSKLLILLFVLSTFLPGLAATSKSLASTALANIRFGPYPPYVYPIRVGIAPHTALTHIYLWQPGAIFVDEKPVFALTARQPYSIAHGRVTNLLGGENFVLPRDRRAYIASYDPRNGYQVWVNNRWYGGVLELISFGDRVTIINFLDLEDYLGGVVPAEMPASWHIEALRAQAVAARSYAYAHTGPGSKWYREGFDVVPDTRDQVYKGQAVATKSTNLAVLSTRGIILKDAGRVKPGFYRAWVGDPFENLNIRHARVSKAVLEKITGVPNIIGVTIKECDPNMNVRSIQIIGTKKTCLVYGVALAKMLHFSTAGILDAKESGNDWVFTYRGPGNGSLGLSQHGANMLAINGWNCNQILQQYYQDPDGKLRLDFMDRYKRPAWPVIRNKTAKSLDTTTETPDKTAKNRDTSTETTDKTSKNLDTTTETLDNTKVQDKTSENE